MTDRYDVMAMLHRGRYCRVLRATPTNNASNTKVANNVVAIKDYPVTSADSRRICENELAVLRRIRHPNVLRLLEMVDTGLKASSYMQKM